MCHERKRNSFVDTETSGGSTTTQRVDLPVPSDQHPPAGVPFSRLIGVGLTLQNTNTLTAEGPEIRIKPVGTRRVFSGGGAQ
ncbi:hypothetical protein GCM10025762_53030 [Haloechinothrix salitolerans]